MDSNLRQRVRDRRTNHAVHCDPCQGRGWFHASVPKEQTFLSKVDVCVICGGMGAHKLAEIARECGVSARTLRFIHLGKRVRGGLRVLEALARRYPHAVAG